MRRGRVFFILALLLILVLVGIVVVVRVVLPMLNRQAPTVVDASPTPPPTQVLYITQNLPQGTALTEDVVSPVPWQGPVIEGMYTSDRIDEVIGRVVKFDLAAQTPIMDSLLLNVDDQLPSAGSPWALSIPRGMVAVSIPVNRLSTVSYAPQRGDHVNVIVSLMFSDVDTDFQSELPNHTGLAIASGPPDPETGENPPLTVGVATLGQSGAVDPESGQPLPPPVLSPGIFGKVVIDPVLGQAVYVVPSEPQRPRMVSHMLLQDVIVLRVGEFPLEGAPGAPGGEPTPTPNPDDDTAVEGEQAPPVRPDVITLIVSPQDAVTLNYILMAQSKAAAQLSLVLRRTRDDTRINILPVTLQFLLEQYQIPVPARLPYSLNPRIDDLILP